MVTQVSDRLVSRRGWKSRLLRWVVAMALALTGLAVVEVAVSPPATAADVPWSCTPTAYLFQAPSGTPTNVYAVNLVTGANTQVGSIAGNYVNAVGFNAVDDYMYGWNQTTDQLVRINADFTLTSLGVPRNGSTVMDRTADWTTGEVTDQGIMWLLVGGTGKWAQVDLTGATPALIATGTATGPANTALPADWAMVNGTLYGVVKGTGSNNTNTAYLVSFVPSTKRFTNLGALSGVTGGGPSFGAVYSDGTYIYAGNNQSGTIYRINPTTRAVINLAQGPVSQMNDGSMCHTPVPTVTLVKRVGGRLVPDDQFEVSLLDPSGATVGSATTTGTATTAETTDEPVVAGGTYTILDRLAPGSTSSADDYTATIACVTSGGVGVGAASPVIGTWTLMPEGANQYVCTVTNTPDPRVPGLHLVKSVSPQGAGALTVGNVLTYRYVATNTGNVPLADVRVTETAFSGTGTPPSLSGCTVASLAPGEDFTCTATYTVTQADVDAGALTNTATANGTGPNGNVPSNNSSTDLTEPPRPAISLIKTALPVSVEKAGTTVTYTFDITNVGNVTVSGLAIREDVFTGAGPIGAATCDATSLIPGAQTVCMATYTVSQDDIDRGVPLSNTATATGTGPGGTPVSASDDFTVDILQNPMLTVVKTAAPTTVDAAGDTVTYTFAVTNGGNATITDLSIVEDTFSGTATPPVLVCAATTLAPQARTTCRGTYTATQADIDAGRITNSGHAHGTTADGGGVDSTIDDAVVGVIAIRGLSLVKTATPASVSAPGQVISYSYRVTNTGNQPVTGLAIAEIFGGAGSAPTATCPTTTLAAGASTTCTASYPVTQADIDAGTVTNSAHATGTNPVGNDVISNDDEADVPAVRHPALSIVKTATPDSVSSAGETITYSYRITNTGNVTETSVGVIEDHFTGAGRAPRPTCPVGAASLAPGASVTCTATYTVVVADLDGAIDNVAHARGTVPNGGGATRSATDEAVVFSPGSDRVAPTVRTTSSQPRVRPGQRFFDHVRVRGVAGRGGVSATARLYGPFSSRAAASCRPAHLARSVTFHVRNGLNRTPRVSVPAPGVYTWKVTTHGNASNLAGSHRCGLASETTTVAKPSYPAPMINGGFSGTILLPDAPRFAQVTVSMPGIGLHAPVAAEAVEGDQMSLPDDVGSVGWLRDSAAVADRIGTTIIAGHVSDRHDRPGAMYRLDRAVRGQTITITAGGARSRFRVTGTATYERETRLPQAYFATTGPHRLVLVSCTDRVLYANGHFHYTRYQVVIAKQVG